MIEELMIAIGLYEALIISGYKPNIDIVSES